MITDYERIEKAIVYLKENFKEQPDLDAVAKQIHLSPFHFQRLFKDWAGVSPKKFLQFISVEYTKGLLKQNLSLADTSFETGLSGTGRLHDLFIGIEGMTSCEFKIGYSRSQKMIFTKLVGDADVDELIPEIFGANPYIDYLHAWNAEACCFICKIERA
jgi:methylphosphotriester-DNA--protein-cysteine methyltransferase